MFEFFSDKNLIRREIFGKVYRHVVDKPEITLIIGPRQAGKTTLMKLIEQKLKQKGNKTLFFNLDVESHNEYFRSQETFLAKLRLEFGGNPGFVFIDEIQRKENAGVFLKGIYDTDLPYKIVASGSGSVELKEKIHESLVGRKRTFELNTLSFSEFVNYRTEYKYADRIAAFFDVEKEKTLNLLKEYMLFGGYPRVVLEEAFEEKRLEMDEIYSSYIDRDIRAFLGIDKVAEYSHLIKILAATIGRVVKLNEIAGTVGISYQTLKKFLYYAEKTFIVFGISPFYSNKLKEISKNRMYYFNDLGMRNYAIGGFGSETVLDGFLFQNFIARVLKELLFQSPYSLHFWRTKDKAEVDFVVIPGKIPIEVKFNFMKIPHVTRSLRSFIGKYHPEKAFVVNLSLEDSLKIGETEVVFLPFYKFYSTLKTTLF